MQSNYTKNVLRATVNMMRMDGFNIYRDESHSLNVLSNLKYQKLINFGTKHHEEIKN